MTKVMLKNPNTGRDDLRIDRSMYDPVKRAILDALAERGEVAFSELRDEVERRTDPALWASSSPGWYTTSVKLDLEARGLLERNGSPQVLTLTDAGRAEHASPSHDD